MTDSPTSPLRRALEVAFWIVAVAFFWTLDTLTKLDERSRTGTGLDDFRLVTNQATSALAVLVMILFVSWWLRQFPLDGSRPWPTVAIGHVVGSGLFAVGHYALMVAQRRLAYGLRDLSYMPDQNHLPNLVYEYKKDIKIYLAVVAILATYRYLRARGASDRGSLTEGSAPTTVDRTADLGVGRPSAASATAETPPAKLAVQTARGELLLDIDRIDYLEAARNYVAVHADGAQYLVRSPIGELTERLPQDRFVRTHRSFLVNLESVQEILSEEGSHSLVLDNGARVPVSRGQRDEVRARLGRLQL